MVVCVPNRQSHRSYTSSREGLQNLTHVHHPEDQHKPLHALDQDIKKNTDLIKNLQECEDHVFISRYRARRCCEDLNALIDENKKMTTQRNSMSMVIDYQVCGEGHFSEYGKHSHDTNQLFMYL